MDYRQFNSHNGLLFYKNIVYVPDRSPHFQAIQHCHDTSMVGHFGINKTLDVSLWRPHLLNFDKDYVHMCDTFCRVKMPWPHLYGLLKPLSISSKPSQTMSLDFMKDLPHSKGFNVINTIVDWYTKMAHFLKITNEETTNLVMPEVFPHYGLPNNIIIDHCPPFIF